MDTHLTLSHSNSLEDSTLLCSPLRVLCVCVTCSHPAIQAGVSAQRLYKPTNRRCSLLVHSPLPLFFSKATHKVLLQCSPGPAVSTWCMRQSDLPVFFLCLVRRSLLEKQGTCRDTPEHGRADPSTPHTCCVWGWRSSVEARKALACCFNASSCTCSPSPPWPSHHLPPAAVRHCRDPWTSATPPTLLSSRHWVIDGWTLVLRLQQHEQAGTLRALPF